MKGLEEVETKASQAHGSEGRIKLFIYVFYAGHAIICDSDKMIYPVFNETKDGDCLKSNLQHWLKRLCQKYDNIFVNAVYDCSRLRSDQPPGFNDEEDRNAEMSLTGQMYSVFSFQAGEANPEHSILSTYILNEAKE